ncbi:RidA family protein [Williamsia soli]|uniref:RidA family protein n=1 Tax=Williamsia soli TaxID=364929 RepID=UPI001A9E2DDE|nr:RidA family protein [Williamsia soli]
MDTIKLLKPEGLVNSPAFSHVAVIPPGATTILVGGQNAVDPNGTLVGGDDVGAQTAQVMTNLKTALAAAGAGMSDVVSLTLYAVDGIDITAGYAVAAQSLDPNSDPPLITAAMVPALGVPGALVELAAVAAVQR